MTVEDFEALKCGDCVRDDASGKVLMINQVRAPGYYAIVCVDSTTFERVNNILSVLSCGEGISLVQKKAAR